MCHMTVDVNYTESHTNSSQTLSKEEITIIIESIYKEGSSKFFDSFEDMNDSIL